VICRAHPDGKKESENVHSHAAPRTKAPRRKVGERLNLLSPVRGDTIIARVVCPGNVWDTASCCFGEVLLSAPKAPGTTPPYSKYCVNIVVQCVCVCVCVCVGVGVGVCVCVCVAGLSLMAGESTAPASPK
jgi:hypothetical protein